METNNSPVAVIKGWLNNPFWRPNPPLQIDISSYNSACLHDSDLKSFDSKICGHTTGAINHLAAVKDRSPYNDHFLSLDYVTVVSNSFSKVIGEVVKFIDNQMEEIWKNKPLFNLVEDYFRISHKTLDFCTAIEEGLNRAQKSQLIIQLAVQQFDEEQQGNGGVEGSEKILYSKTLERLVKFKMDDDRFPKEFFRLVYSFCDDLVSMLEKLKERDNKMDKKLKEKDMIKTWKMVSMTIFGATSALILVCLAVEEAVAEPPVLTALAVLPVLEDGWLNSIWEKYENTVKGQRDLMRTKTSSAFWDLDYICIDVDNLKTKMKDLLASAETEKATVEHNASAVEMAIDAIRKKSTAFKEAIQNLHEKNEECRRDTRKAMIDVSHRIKKYSST